MKRLILLSLLLVGCGGPRLAQDRFHGHTYLITHKSPGMTDTTYAADKVTLGEGFARFYCGGRFYALSGDVRIEENPLPKARRK